MGEQRSNEILRQSRAIRHSLPNPRGGECLELRECDAHRPLVRLDDPFVARDEGGDGNRLRRRKREVIEDPPICLGVAILLAQNVLSLSQAVARSRVLILAKGEEFSLTHFAAQSKRTRTNSEPFASDLLPFLVVVAYREVFCEIALGVGQTVLGLCRDHATQRSWRLTATGAQYALFLVSQGEV